MKVLPNGLRSGICNTCCYLRRSDIMEIGKLWQYRCEITGSIGEVHDEDRDEFFTEPKYRILPDCPLKEANHERSI